MKVAILTEIPAPFRIPLFNALAAERGFALRVLFLANRDPRRRYLVYTREMRFEWRTLRGWSRLLRGRWLVVNRGVRRELARFDPHVVIVGGWNQPAFWQARRWARRAGRPLVVWVESTGRDERPGSGLLERAKRALVREAAAVLVPGRAAREYAASLGAAPERIAVAPNAADLALFRDRVEAARGDREALRAELGVGGCVFLCVSRLSREKGVDVLVRAFREVPEGQLVVAGDGPDAAAVRAAAGERVRFLGDVPRDDLPRWYAAADALVLPSRSETWGMVLNEGAAAGLPLVASEAAGGGYDLIEDGVNGFRVPVEDEAALAGALTRVAADPEWRARAGERSRELAAGHTPEVWAAAVAALARRIGSNS